jgi:hypothetical protein
MFATDTLARFRERICAVLTRDLQLDPGFSFDLASASTELLAKQGTEAFGAIRAILSQWGVVEQWVQVLDHERSLAIAEWVAPYLRGTVLDLLCGNGRVGEQLWELGSPVILTEREHAYPLDRTRHTVPFVHFSDHATTLPACDTVLLCTALHHEEDPDALLATAARTTAARLVIVESVAESDCPPELGRLMDLFVNRCLTSTRLRLPSRHRPVEAWMAPDVCRGRIAAIERRDSVPGVPLVHALIVVDLERTAYSGLRAGNAPRSR